MAAKKRGSIPQDRMFDVPRVRVKPKTSSTPDPIKDARRFHGWTQHKLEVLNLYLKKYRTVAGNGTYIDTCAGDGRAKIRGEVVDGSVAVALSTGSFKEVHLFELPDVMPRLDHFLAYKYTIRMRRRITTHQGDVNVELPKLLAMGVIPKDRPCFAFVDPNSTEIDWDTVAALAAYKTFDPTAKPVLCKVEQWILVNTGHALQRLWTSDRSKLPPKDSAATLDRVMGGRNAWIDLHREGWPATHLAHRYADRMISELGYEYAVAHGIKGGSSKSRIQYFMVHATDHHAAVDFMKWAESTPTERRAQEAKLPL